MFRIKKGYMLREVSEEYVVVPVGAAAKEFVGMIRLNSTAAFLWELIADGATEESLLEALCEEFEGEEGFTEELGKRDVTAFLQTLKEHNLVVEDAQ